MTENKEFPEEKLEEVTGGNKLKSAVEPLKDAEAEQVTGGADIGDAKPIEVEVYNTWEVIPTVGTVQPHQYQYQPPDPVDGENFIAKS